MTGRVRVADRRKFWSGCLFMSIGAVALWQLPRPLGSLTEMGPGFFPMVLGTGLVLVGAVSVFAGVLSGQFVAIEPIPWLPLSFILGGVVSTGLLMTQWGLIPSLLCLVAMSCYARLWRHPMEVIAIYAVVLALIWGIFIMGVQLPIDLLW